MTFNIIVKDRILEKLEENDGLPDLPLRVGKDGRVEVNEKDVQRKIQYDAERDRRGLVNEDEKREWKKMGYKPDA